MIPVSIITGFLGSGKTTLIGRILRDPAFARTAVIVNEYGEIGLDHELILHGDETFLTLTTGCLCCAVRSDLIETLLDLSRRADGRYDRVLIETSGRADPVPILQALMADPAVVATHVVDTLITVVDSVHGADSLVRFAEARRQVALADLLLFSKTDLAAPSTNLLSRVDDLNPSAARVEGRIAVPAALFSGADPMARATRLARAPHPASAASPFGAATHTAGIETAAFRRAHPLPALALMLWLQALAEHCGERILRLKGLVSIDEMPEQPAVVHGVRHIFSAPEFLPRWPSEDTDTRLVFIFHDIPRHFPARLLDAIEQEVRDELAAAGRTPD
jgi:G3E family GTPase